MVVRPETCVGLLAAAYIHFMHKVTAVVFFLSIGSLSGQQPSTALVAGNCDSLHRVLSNARAADTTQLDALLALLRSTCIKTNTDSAMHIAERAIALAARLKDRPRQIAAHRAKADVFAVPDQMDSAIAELEKCLPLLDPVTAPLVAEKVHLNLATRYERKMDLTRSVVHYETALRLRERRGDRGGVAELLNSLGTIRVQQGDVAGALRYHERAFGVFEGLGDSSRMAAVLNRIGVALRENGQPKEALGKHARSLVLYRALGREIASSAALNNMAAAYNDMGEFGKAEAYAREGLAIRQRGGETTGVAFSLIQLGWARLQLGNAAEALKHGERARGISKKARLLTIERDACELLYAANKALGRSDAALATYERFTLLRDSFVSEENQRAVLRQEYEHQAYRTVLADSLRHVEASMRVEQERKMERMAGAAQRKRIIFGALIIALFSAGTGYFFFDRRRRQMRFEREQAVFEERLRIADDLHDDLGAGLSSLKLRSALALDRTNAPDQQEALRALAGTADGLMDNMRQILWAMGTEHTRLADLVRYINVYARQQLDESGIALETTTEGELPELDLNAMERRNIFLVAKEALHNTVKHAGARQVTITFRWNNGLEMRVNDDGAGMASADATKGNGMRTMRKRAVALGGTVEVGSGTLPGTTVVLRVPLPNTSSRAAPGRSDL